MLEYDNKSFETDNKTFNNITERSPIQDIYGLTVWLEPSKKNFVFDDSNRMSMWKDISGNVNNAIQINEQLKPLYSNKSNGKYNSMMLDSDKNMVIKNITINTFSVFIILKANDSRYIYQYGNNTNGMYLNGGNNSIGVKSEGLASIKSAGNDWIISNDWKMLQHSYNGTHTTHSIKVNNAGIVLNNYLNNTKSPIMNITTDFILGSSLDNYGFSGNISEFILFDRRLNLDENEIVVNYLRTKYTL